MNLVVLLMYAEFQPKSGSEGGLKRAELVKSLE
jgi:hypothetical protein